MAEPAREERDPPIPPASSDIIPRCRIRNHRGLEALGLAGDSVDLHVELGVLHLKGTAGGSTALTPGSVVRLRFYRHPFRLRSPGYDEIELWREDNRPPLFIGTFGADRSAFARVIAAFALAVAAVRGPSALQVGATGLAAIQHWIQVLIYALAWFFIFGGAVWVLTGPARILGLAALSALGWTMARRLRAMWSYGSLWRRDVDCPAEFLAAVERGAKPW